MQLAGPAISIDSDSGNDRQDKQGHHKSKFIPSRHLVIEFIEKRRNFYDRGNQEQDKWEPGGLVPVPTGEIPYCPDNGEDNDNDIIAFIPPFDLIKEFTDQPNSDKTKQTNHEHVVSLSDFFYFGSLHLCLSNPLFFLILVVNYPLEKLYHKMDIIYPIY